MKPHIIGGLALLFLASLMFEFVLIHEGQNEYPGAVTGLIMIAGVVLMAASKRNYQESK